MSAVDIAHLQEWVGREQTVEDAMNPFPARALAAALDVVHLPGAGDVLPPAWHWLYFLDTPSAVATSQDGHPTRGGFLPAVPLPRRMWAAGNLHVEALLQLGVSAHKQSTIKSVELKQGKAGALVFVVVEHALYQQDRLCIREAQNIVYRDMPTSASALPAGDLPTLSADWSTEITPDPVLLFRYSALTYNGHRIHYDRQYAIAQEFYPALVVHGPLLATLILDLVARQVPDARVAQFSFRAVRPTFDLGAIRVCGRRQGQQLTLWTTDHKGYVGMTATAVLA